MFDIYQTKPIAEHIPYIKQVKVENAPTIDSVCLLREMEAAAINNIISTAVNADNTFEFSSHIFYSPHIFGRQVHTQFKLNGKQYQFKKDIPGSSKMLTPQENAKQIYDEVIRNLSETLAKVITIDIIKQFIP